MCYDLSFLTRKAATYADRLANQPETRQKMTQQFAALQQQVGPNYHTTGYNHPYIPVLTNEFPDTPQLYQWGLIPFWAKDEQTAGSIRRKTINARGEQLYERASYKAAVKYRRCIIIADGFFEHHHYQNQKYPFYVQPANHHLLLIAGIWDRWEHPASGNVLYTVSVVTTKATGIMEQVHNNPKLKEARMPLLLDDDRKAIWMRAQAQPKPDWLNQVLAPVQPPALRVYPVAKIRGKKATGNIPEVRRETSYPELPVFWT